LLAWVRIEYPNGLRVKPFRKEPSMILHPNGQATFVPDMRQLVDKGLPGWVPPRTLSGVGAMDGLGKALLLLRGRRAQASVARSAGITPARLAERAIARSGIAAGARK